MTDLTKVHSSDLKQLFDTYRQQLNNLEADQQFVENQLKRREKELDEDRHWLACDSLGFLGGIAAAPFSVGLSLAVSLGLIAYGGFRVKMYNDKINKKTSHIGNLQQQAKLILKQVGETRGNIDAIEAELLRRLTENETNA